MVTRRVDARRNEQALLDAAAAAFVAAGVEAPVRDIAARAGVGVGTIYRHFPTRADLVVAVYRHQVEACAEAGPDPLAAARPYAALARWIDLFVDFLVTKHGLAAALRSGQRRLRRPCTPTSSTGSCRCAPGCSTRPPRRARSAPTCEAYELMRGVGNLCIGAEHDPRYDARRLVELLVAGLRS